MLTHLSPFNVLFLVSLYTTGTLRISHMPKSHTINISLHNNTYHFFYNRGSHTATKLIKNISQTRFYGMGKEGRSNDLILSFMSLAHWQIFQFVKEEKFWIKEALKMNQLRIQMQSKPKSKVYYILKFKHELGIKKSSHAVCSTTKLG